MQRPLLGRTRALNQGLLGFFNGIAPGLGDRVASANALLNPIDQMGEAGANTVVAFDPSYPDDVRRRAALNAGIGTVTAAAPAIGGAAIGAPARRGILETVANVTGPMDDAAQRFLVDEDGAIRVWHGSPHDFDRFSMDKIGTGEGAQAYGHGLYFAENEGVARGYRDRLSTFDPYGSRRPNIAMVDGRPAREMGQDVWEVADQMAARGVSVDEYIAHLDSQIAAAKNPNRAEVFLQMKADAERVAERLRGKDVRFDGGRLYEVNIDANPEDFLDWDAPITDAPEAFQNWVRQRMDEVDLPEGTRRQRQLHAWRGDWTPPEGVYIPPPRVAEAKNWLADYGATQVEMTDALREAGIPGIRYLDAGSRGAGDGSRNYVVFDDRLVDILSKDGVKTPEGHAQGVLDLLTSGRAAEVTDEMLDMGDPVLNARLNEYLFNNYDLPMDEASRMARAGEIGRDVPAYRGTMSDENTAREAQFVSPDPNVTQSFAGHISFADEVGIPPELAQSEGGNIMPLMVDPSRNTSALRGYEMKLPGDNIRSRFARFDPRLAHLRNLSAGIGGMGLLGYIGDQQQDDGPAYLPRF